MGIMLVALLIGLFLQLIYSCIFKVKFLSGWLITVLILVVGILGGLLSKGEYFESEEPEVVRLAGIEYLDVDSRDGAKFISRDRNNTYTYLREVIDVNGKINWETRTISSSTPFIIIEKEEYTEPLLCIYTRGYRRTFWTFSLGNFTHDYVFRLPVSEQLPFTTDTVESQEEADLPQIEQEVED